MATKNEHLVSMNGEYMFLYVDNAKYAPLRINEHTAQTIERSIETQQPSSDSCIMTISSAWDSGKFILNTNFHKTTKCTSCFTNPSTRTKNEMCLQRVCAGKCTDEFMCNVVAKKILPDLYKNKQI